MNNLTLFQRLVFINQTLFKRNANDKNISRGQGKVLVTLHMKDGISTKELSEKLNINVTSLNETLNKLLEKGYVEKIPSDKDKRVLLIYLTEKGRNIRPEPPKDLDVFDCLNEMEKETLDEYLTRISMELNKRMKNENPEKYEKMIKYHQELFKELN